MCWALAADVARFAVNVMGVPRDAARTKLVAHEGIDRLEDYFRSVGMPVDLAELASRSRSPTDDESRFAEMAAKKPMAKPEILGVYRLARKWG
ncbi:MAG: hypothetical protein A2413_02760 [Treponema sp. RIFOXYC1_FULL_61_9]|nr:MAG: hypothetical protein A2001_10705 [Treponema sp. GWC1_61_84]OHE72504.1 MAG: hypothetical protein A2413_02760 [Treponema sp. RIFOXYC1_FULL_61_9]